jgi:hypothetical protein
VSSPAHKNISVFQNENQVYISPVHPTEGRIAIVTDAGLDAMDASGAFDESACLRTEKSCGSGAPTLASSLAGYACGATEANKPGLREEHEGSR